MEVILQTRMAMIRQKLNSLDMILDLNPTKKSDGTQTAWGPDKVEVIKKKDAEYLRFIRFCFITQ